MGDWGEVGRRKSKAGERRRSREGVCGSRGGGGGSGSVGRRLLQRWIGAVGWEGVPPPKHEGLKA